MDFLAHRRWSCGKYFDRLCSKLLILRPWTQSDPSDDEQSESDFAASEVDFEDDDDDDSGSAFSDASDDDESASASGSEDEEGESFFVLVWFARKTNRHVVGDDWDELERKAARCEST